MPGEVLVQEKIITKQQLEAALQTQKKEMGLALGDIVCRDFSIPQEKIETLFVNAVLLPVLKDWFPKTFKDKLEIKGVDFGLFITGFDISDNLYISKKAHLILPTHRILDAASEQKKGESKIGSTLKGIGPTYKDKIGREGLRVGDLLYNFEESSLSIVPREIWRDNELVL